MLKKLEIHISSLDIHTNAFHIVSSTVRIQLLLKLPKFSKKSWQKLGISDSRPSWNGFMVLTKGSTCPTWWEIRSDHPMNHPWVSLVTHSLFGSVAVGPTNLLTQSALHVIKVTVGWGSLGLRFLEITSKALIPLLFTSDLIFRPFLKFKNFLNLWLAPYHLS